MKQIMLLPVLAVFTVAAFAQPRPSQKEKAPTAAEIEKMMEAEMKGMSEEEKAQMRKMMKGIMPEMAKKPGSDVIAFTDNKKLVPAKDVARIQRITKKIFTDADVAANTVLLYDKLMAKMPAAEKMIATNVMAKAKTGPLLMEAATISFIQGRNYAAMALALKAVQASPKNVIYQNNLAAILSQSGYPENAIPYLKKLSAQFPFNSTVLHNLGYAWLQLGRVDTARRFFAYAAVHNPNNPETSLCRGVIEELRGDPKKAADHYAHAFEMAPDQFTENMAKNVKAEGRLDKIDFNKLKSRITIYEYFKKDWIKIPALADDVAHYESNKRIQNGYSGMFTKLDNKIDALAEASSAELQALADKGEAEFIQTMAKENQKGISMISMPAVYINKILMAHIVKWQENYVTEYHNLLNEIRQRKQVMTKSGNNDKCPDYDRKNNAFLQYANPLIRKFHAIKIEEARVWLNAFCTWSWYITGNPKNVVLTQCITWTSFIAKMYESAIHDQYAIAQSCVSQNGDKADNIAEPAIPNFTCPAVISIPFGLDELRLSADAVNFDNNDWEIKKAGAKNHNLTLTHGIDKNYIAEPGKYGNPTTKTGNGYIMPPALGDNDLMPLSRIMDDLTPLSKISPDELAPLDPSLLRKGKLNKNDLSKVRNAQITRKLLSEMLQVKCPGELPAKKQRKKFVVGIGKIEFDKEFEVGVDWEGVEWWDEEVRAWVNGRGEYRFENGFTVGIGEIEFEDVKTTGPQTTITNGLDPIGTLINFIKGLFD